MNLEEVIAYQNPWWQTHQIHDVHQRQKRRLHYHKILLECHQWFKDYKVLLIEGPRQVGKTTILYHLIDHFLKNGVPPKALCYLDLQHPDLRKMSLADLFTQVNKVLLSNLNHPHFPFLPLVFLDEIQSTDNWGDWLKIFADDPRMKINIMATGSAIRLARGKRETGVGRWKNLKVPHLSFYEYMQISEDNPMGFTASSTWNWKEPEAKQFAILQTSLSDYQTRPTSSDTKTKTFFDHFNDFLMKGGYPRPSLQPVVTAQEEIRDNILGKVIQDPIELKIIRGSLELKNLLYHLANHAGGILNKENICKESGLNKVTLNDYLQILEDLHMIFRMPLQIKEDHGTKALKSHDKLNFHSACVVSAIKYLGEPKNLKGSILESAVASEINACLGDSGFLSYWREHSQAPEIDIIANLRETMIPIEIKTKIKKNGLSSFLEKFEANTPCAYLLKADDDWKWDERAKKPLITMPIPHFLYCLSQQEEMKISKELRMLTQISTNTIKIELPINLRNRDLFQKEKKKSFLEKAEGYPFIRWLIGPENLADTAWNINHAQETIFSILQNPPQIRPSKEGWHPGANRLEPLKGFDEGVGVEKKLGKHLKLLRLYYNGVLEFGIHLDYARLYYPDAPYINPYSLVEYTVNFFRLYKKLAEILSLSPPFWFELNLGNAQRLKLRGGHPQSIPYLRSFSAEKTIQKNIVEVGVRIPLLNPFKDIETFEVLKILYHNLGLGTDQVPFFDSEGNCNID